MKFPEAHPLPWWPGLLVVRVRERGITSAQEAAHSNRRWVSGGYLLN